MILFRSLEIRSFFLFSKRKFLHMCLPVTISSFQLELHLKANLKGIQNLLLWNVLIQGPFWTKFTWCFLKLLDQTTANYLSYTPWVFHFSIIVKNTLPSFSLFFFFKMSLCNIHFEKQIPMIKTGVIWTKNWNLRTM